MEPAAAMTLAYERISAGDLDGFGELLADDFVEHEDLGGLPPSKAGVLDFFRMFLTGFPDLRMDPEDILLSDDKVVARARATGTHQGEFMGVPATGKPIDVQIIDIIRFEGDGLAHEHWGLFDSMSMMQQIGALPGPPG